MDTALHRIEVADLAGGSFDRTAVTDRCDAPRVEVFGILPHDGVVRELVLSLKYGGDKSAALRLAELVAGAVRSELVPSTIDRVTWAPTTDARRISREFDHAELIARHVGALCGLRVRAMLRRTNTGSQTASSRADRLVRPVFVARPGIVGHVLVIDDVVTTGATFAAAARALVASGARAVTCLAPSWTPDRRSVSRPGALR